jgi:hypothetical protein
VGETSSLCTWEFGHGQFGPGTPIYEAQDLKLCITGDFNHDGNLDLAVTRQDNQLQIFLGNDDGTFSAPVVTALTNAGSPLAAADFNGDGKLDLAVGLSLCRRRIVVWLCSWETVTARSSLLPL